MGAQAAHEARRVSRVLLTCALLSSRTPQRDDHQRPSAAIRDRVKGYSASIVKGGADAIGRSAGGVRPPLQNLASQDLADLKALNSTVS